MRFGDSDRADSSQIIDRRGAGRAIGLGAGGLGVVGTLIVVVVRLLGGDVTTTDGSGPNGVTRTTSASDSPIVSKSCQGVTAANDHGEFIACVQNSVQTFWKDELPKHREAYRPAKLVLFTNATSSACGTASASTGPFYCPVDHEVYLDLDFFRELSRRFHARGGEFAEAYVVAHEYGHHVQSLLGTEQAVQARSSRSPRDRNAFSVRLELQADCYAGVWGHSAYETGKVADAEIAQALDAAAAVGDDRIQSQVQGRVRPETFTHGSSAERQKWFRAGFDGGDPAACDTFGDTLGR